MTRNYEWAGPNTNVAEILHKYCYEDGKPPFALMLNGSWGCGKTWFVEKFIKENRLDRQSDSETKIIYVSLYGIQNTNEINDAIFTELHPSLGGKMGTIAKIATNMTIRRFTRTDIKALDKDIKKLLASVGYPNISYIKNKKNTFKKYILVFDDMERSKLPIIDVLSIIHSLTLENENRVILLCNEDEINENDKAAYYRIKEKTVYLTLSLTPDVKSAWNETLKILPPDVPFKKFLESRTENFISFIEGTKQQNFRLLHFFMNFGKDLFPSFKGEKDQEYNGIVFDILRLLYGLIVEKNIHGRTYGHILEIYNGSTNEKEEKKFPYSVTRGSNYYDMIKTYTSLCEVIYAFIESGTLDKEEFENKISYFLRSKETPIWKKLSTFHFEKPSPKHYDSLIKEFGSYLEEKTAENDGEFLHVCDIYHMLEKANINEFNNKNSSGLLKEYTLRYYGTLSENASLLSNGNRYLDIKDLRYLGFMEENLKEIKKINDKLFQKKDELIRENNKKHYDKTIENCHPSEIMELFSRPSAPMADTPFIHTIDPNDFLTCMDQLPSGLDQHKIYQELYHRLQKAAKKTENSETDEATKSSWQNERKWFEIIIEKLQQRADDTATHPLIKKLTEDHLKTLREGL